MIGIREYASSSLPSISPRPFILVDLANLSYSLPHTEIRFLEHNHVFHSSICYDDVAGWATVVQECLVFLETADHNEIQSGLVRRRRSSPETA